MRWPSTCKRDQFLISATSKRRARPARLPTPPDMETR